MTFREELPSVLETLIYCFLAFWLAACGGSDSSSQQIAPGQDSVTTTGLNSPEDTSKTLLEQATRRMIEDGMNVPVSSRHTDQGFASSFTLAQEFIDRYEQAHDFIQTRIGGYPNWNVIVTDEDGTDADNQPVFDLLERIGFDNNSNEPWTTQRVVETAGCLTGSAPNGHDPSEVGANYVQHSLS